MKKLKRKAQEITKEIKKPIKKKKKEKITQVLSTGSTLLDLNLLGKRVHGGGMPGGIIVEIYGPSATGKTALLAELAGSCQANKGDVRFEDPEGRLDAEYSRIYGFELDKENYCRPDTVRELFEGLWKWEPPNPKVINVTCADSLAALSTEMEMDDQDKYGMKRAKDFSEGLRKTCRLIANNNWLVVCSNQERVGGTPGGKGVPYHASIRIRLTPVYQKSKIKKQKKIGNKSIEKTIGIRSECTITKSSKDEPYRKCNISIIFGYGIDDIRENLIYIKEMTNSSKYICPDGTEYATIDKTISYIEDNDLEEELKTQVIELWYEIEEKFKMKRKNKRRQYES